jgi:pimeloyl-ACP methyl ester carboxylesterase
MANQNKKKRLAKHILKISAIVMMTIIVLSLVTVLAGRGVYAIKLNIKDGVQEQIFITLGGIEQAIHIRGKNTNNPVIIVLHGGPGWSDAYEMQPWQYKMENDYTFVRWDQRGSGRTYSRNPDAPLSLDIMVSDVDDLVDYVTARFAQPVIIIGDSWGSILGITYATQYPEKIAGFVGVAQVVSNAESDRIALETGIERAMAAGNIDDAKQMKDLYERIEGKNFSDAITDVELMEDFYLVQHLPAKYLAPRYESQLFGIVFSPWFGFHETKELISVMVINNSLFLNRNRQLFYAMDSFMPPKQLDVPVAFIMGSEDYITNTALVVDYCDSLKAPSKNVFIVEEAGHSPYRSQPEVFVEMLREALQEFSK